MLFISIITIFILSGDLLVQKGMGALHDKVFLNDVNEISIPMGASYRQTQHNSYLPQYASIENGSIVRWMNQDILDHTATADDESFDTSVIGPNESHSIMINSTGRFQVSLHNTPMVAGRIKVDVQLVIIKSIIFEHPEGT